MARSPAAPITVSPTWQAWRDALAGGPSPLAVEFRRELGLPADGPIVMSGHQPTIWHPGILAKWLATQIAADCYDATPAWVVVDHDLADPFRLRLPVLREGRLDAFQWQLSPAAAKSGTGDSTPPALSLSARVIRRPELDADAIPAVHSVENGIADIVRAMNAHADSANAAMQTVAAISDLASALQVGEPAKSLVGVVQRWRPMHVIAASALSRTTLFRRVMERFEDDDAREAYADATRRFPAARIKPLKPGELPAWEIEGTVRRAARVDTWRRVDPTRITLAPRALLLTFLLRAAGCELFVHGLGGGGEDGTAGYDRVMEHWGKALFANIPLAPTATVSATLRLPLEFPAASAERERTIQAAHRARHDPRVLEDASAEAIRAPILEHLAAAPRKSSERRALYGELHRALARYRDARRAELETLEAAAARARATPSSAHTALDRTWAFPLYPRLALESLLAPLRTHIKPWDQGA